MKYVFQIGMITIISFAAELLHYFIPLPIPASVYGLIIMFLLLCMKLVKPEQVEDVSGFMLAIMPILFIEPSVGLMTSAGAIKGQALFLVLMCLLSTIAVMLVTGLTAQAIIRSQKRKAGNKHE